MVWLRPRRVAAGVTLALTLVGGSRLGAADAFDIELRPVSEGVFVAIRPDVFREPYESNTTLIINEQPTWSSWTAAARP